MHIEIIKTELTDDPLAVGYSGMDDAAAAASMNDTTAGRTLPVNEFSSAQIYEMIDRAEFDGLGASDKDAVDRVLGLGERVSVAPASKARAVLLAAFGAGTNSRAAMIAAVVRAVGRAEELGLPFVKVGHVQEARK